MQKIKKRHFSNMIVLTFIGIILSMFSLVFLSFHFVINRHIDSLTKDSIKNELMIMDEMMESSYAYTDEEDSSIFIPTEYIILNNQMNTLFLSADPYAKKTKETTDFIVSYISEHTPPTEDRSMKIKVQNKIYLVGGKYYEGIYEDGVISKAISGEHANRYLYIVYMDITAMQQLIDTLNQCLMIILICIGGLSMILIFKILKQVQVSFNSLDKYLIKIGNREEIEEIPRFSYEEFSNIVNTIDEMSKRITQSEQLQKQFFQNASHELRTPLMSIQGYAEGLKYNVIKDTEASYDIILKESKRMSDLVDEILFLSKFEAQVLNRDNIELDELLYSCGNQVYIKDRHSHISILWDLQKDITIIGDESLLQRAFSNILSNALRYAKSQICVCAATKKEMVEVHIIDDGDGILSKDMPHIFERFYKGKGGNFGIGLSMTKDIIEKYNGTITVSSQRGFTDFCVELPHI